MKKVRTRALSVLLLVGIAVLGMGFYVGRYVFQGAQWASAPFNAAVYRRGVLTVGTVIDRNGVVLADVTGDERTFASNADVRRSTLHAVGDAEGNVGTGALSVFASDLTGYNLITGSYSLNNRGRQVQLTIDSRLNAVAFRALEGRRGVVMVSNYKTGEIICMVSSPTFDPANPPADLNTSSLEGVYVNRAIQSAFTPGSIFKVVTAAAAIERIPNVYDLTFTCTGEVLVGNDLLICPGSHGTLGIERGMQVSCNIVYGELALELGADTMAEFTGKFGLTTRTRINGIRTAIGNFDKAAPGSVNLAWSGVGQYTNTVCPASMLRFIGAVANNGSAAELHFRMRTGVSSVIPSGSQRLLSRDTASKLSELMEIQNRQNFPGLEIYAKSGTAQVGGNNAPHAWYTGYITNPDHPYAFIVIVENGGGGTAVAAPIANRVLQEIVG